MSERETCSKERPMPKGDAGRWQHPDASEVDQEDYGLGGGGSYAVYVCPNCNLRFRVMLPD
jgi:hypothetical protein